MQSSHHQPPAELLSGQDLMAHTSDSQSSMNTLCPVFTLFEVVGMQQANPRPLLATCALPNSSASPTYMLSEFGPSMQYIQSMASVAC